MPHARGWKIKLTGLCMRGGPCKTNWVPRKKKQIGCVAVGPVGAGRGGEKKGHAENRPVGPEAVGPDLVCHMAYLGLKIGPSLGLLLG